MIGEKVLSAVNLAGEAKFALGPIEVRPATREVLAGGVRRMLEPRIMQVLVVLARRRGEVVSRDELIAACWGGRAVVDEAIHRCIGAIRRLAETHGGFSITTVARVGYRLEETSIQARGTQRRPFPKRSSLVGRDREQGELRGLLDGARAGRGAMALLAGEPGIGKTRLAEETGADAVGSGALVLTGCCRTESGGAPYLPFIEMLGELMVSTPADRLRDILGEDGGYLAKLWPELRRRFDDIPAPAELPPEHERRLLFNAVRDFLRRAARTQPLVLVLEDLHWADDPSLKLLTHLAESVLESPILIVGTYRNTDRDLGRGLLDWLEDVTRRRLGERLALCGLAEDETAALVCDLVGQDLPRTRLVGPDTAPPWVTDIHQKTAGNPFYIEELVRHLAEAGRLFDAGGVLASDIVNVGADVPEGVRLVIGRRLARLTDTARKALTGAALIGNQFRTELLLALDLSSLDGLLEAIDEAESAGLIKAEGPGYRFSHDLVRQTLVATTPQQRRQRLHLQIADAMKRLNLVATDERVAELARHLYEAGAWADPAETAGCLLRAGNHALAHWAYEEALAAFDAGLSLDTPLLTDLRAGLHYGRGKCCFELFLGSDGICDLEESLNYYERIDDKPSVFKLSYILSEHLWRERRIAEALEICRRALAIVGDVLSKDRAALLAREGYYLCLLREYAAGDSRFAEAFEVADRLADPEAIRAVCETKATLHGFLGETCEELEFCVKTVTAAREAQNVSSVGATLTRMASALYNLARWDEAEDVLDEVEPLVEKIGNTYAWKVCQMRRSAIGHRKRGTFYTERDRVYWRKLSQEPYFRLTAFFRLAQDDFLSGRWDDAAQAYEAALSLSPSDPACWSALLLLRTRMNDRDHALPMLAERWSPLKPAPTYERRPASSWDRLAAIAEALVLLKLNQEAAVFYPALFEYSKQQPFWGRILGMTAAAGGRWAQAEAHFGAALDLAERLPDRVGQADIRQDWARSLLRRGSTGDRPRAIKLLSDAAERYQGMGMARHLEGAKAMIATA